MILANKCDKIYKNLPDNNRVIEFVGIKPMFCENGVKYRVEYDRYYGTIATVKLIDKVNKQTVIVNAYSFVNFAWVWRYT